MRGAVPELKRSGLRAFAKSIPLIGGAIKEAPEFARTVQEVFDGHLHKTLATLRRDGSPRRAPW